MKIAMFTDLHWGKKNNSLMHNQDCDDYIDWFIALVKKHKCEVIMFLGDWFENRNSVNVMTLNYSHRALKKLNALGLPIYIIVGNHDLYHRENRSVFSTNVFDEFKNVVLISEPTQVFDDVMMSPYIFKDEYPALAKFNNLKYWMGHFEFRNFVVTGSDRKMEQGPDHKLFTGPMYIFSGHFHKRQALDNVIYIGNCFPMDYGDAWDDKRGAAILDTSNDDVDFFDWEDCPKYRKVKLSTVLTDPNLTFPPKTRVRCVIDAEIGYSDAQQLRDELTKSLGLREFVLEENLYEKKDAIAGEEVLEDFDLSSLNDAVVKMIESGVSGTTTIDPTRLIHIYERL